LVFDLILVLSASIVAFDYSKFLGWLSGRLAGLEYYT
jgi:hypothetical protein